MAGREEPHSMLLCELLDQAVLLEVGLRLVLNVVVQRHDNLVGIVDLGGANGHELGRDRPAIVVGHTVMRLERYVVAGLDLLPRGEPHGVPLDDLLGEGLGCRGSGAKGGAGGLELRSEGILGTRGGIGGAGRVGEAPRVGSGVRCESRGGSRERGSGGLGGADGCKPPLERVSTQISDDTKSWALELTMESNGARRERTPRRGIMLGCCDRRGPS